MAKNNIKFVSILSSFSDISVSSNMIRVSKNEKFVATRNRKRNYWRNSRPEFVNRLPLSFKNFKESILMLSFLDRILNTDTL